MDREYAEELKKIEAILVEFLPAVPNTFWCNRVFPLPGLKAEAAEALLAPGRELFLRGGKRWRPLLAHLLCRALGGGDAALPLLPLVEFTHNASLIHDDLEDNSDERRGKPAIHLIYGSDTAINSGSFFYFLPLIVLENFSGDAEDKNHLWQLWARHIRFLHLGQSMDIAWHRNAALIPSVDDYLLMCRLKTGALARFAALLGIEAARISLKNANPPKNQGGAELEALMEPLGEAAQKLGVGFQILDDVKNLSAGIPGKKRGDDVVEGKKSLPVLLFLHLEDSKETNNGEMNTREERANFVERCFRTAGERGADIPEVEEFITALTGTGVLKEAEIRGKTLISEAGTVFSSLKAVNSEAGRLLAGFSELLGNAES